MKNALLLVLVGLPFIDAAAAVYASMATSASSSGASASASASTSSTGAIHKVDVGEDGFTFDPDTLVVAPGEKVEFHFYPQNHSVAQASFGNPCQPKSGSGFSSGFVPTTAESKTVFTLTVNDTSPIWYYCGQIGHCQAGMVGVINAPAGGQVSLDAFKKAAQNAKLSTIPAMVQGGSLGEPKAESPSSTVSTSTAASASGTASSTTSAGSRGSSSSTGSTGSTSATSTPNVGSSMGTALGMALVLALSCFVSLSLM